MREEGGGILNKAGGGAFLSSSAERYNCGEMFDYVSNLALFLCDTLTISLRKANDERLHRSVAWLHEGGGATILIGGFLCNLREAFRQQLVATIFAQFNFSFFNMAVRRWMTYMCDVAQDENESLQRYYQDGPRLFCSDRSQLEIIDLTDTGRKLTAMPSC